jgi:P4 family phage/plasmid primase-like protien
MSDNQPAQRGPAASWDWWIWRRPGGEIDDGETLKYLPVDDTRYVRLMHERYPDLHKHVPGPQGGSWLLWDGKFFRPDDSSEAAKLVLGSSQELAIAMAACKTEVHRRAEAALGAGAEPVAIRNARAAAWKPWEAAEKYAAGLRKNAGRSGATASYAVACGAPASEFGERHPEWLNCEDGTWDLRTLWRKGHDPADRITHCLPAPDMYGGCPMFLGVVQHLAGNDPDVAGYILRLLGYCLLGGNPERKIFFWVGPTGSGKSVVLNVVRRLLGPLATDSNNDLICVTRHGRNARTENSVRGRRLVTLAESSEYKRIDEAQLKRMTGEERVNVDKHYATETIDTAVTWTIVMPTNDLPAMSKPDDALRDRFAVVPTGQPMPHGQRIKDYANKITESEGSAVLWLLMRFASRYLAAHELPEPLAVTAATDAYFGMQDSVAAFLGESAEHTVTGWVDKSESWKRYCAWAGDDRPLTRNGFHASMKNQPGIRLNDGSNRYEGITWKTLTYSYA